MNSQAASKLEHHPLNTLFKKECATPSDINEHLPLLQKLSEAYRNVVELGMRYGSSTVALLAGLPDRLTSVDVVVQQGIADKLVGYAEELGVHFAVIEGDSLKVEFDHDIGMLFIDSLHTKAQLAAELKLHSPAVIPGGVIVIHDTETYRDNGEDANSKGRGLVHAIDEFLAGNDEWSRLVELKNNNGLTILARAGGEVSDVVTALSPVAEAEDDMQDPPEADEGEEDEEFEDEDEEFEDEDDEDGFEDEDEEDEELEDEEEE